MIYGDIRGFQGFSGRELFFRSFEGPGFALPKAKEEELQTTLRVLKRKLGTQRGEYF